MALLHFIQVQEDGDTPGRIMAYVQIPEENHIADLAQGIAIDSKPDLPNSYYADGAVQARPSNPTTLTGNVLSSLPVGSKLFLFSSSGKTQSYDVTEDTVTLNFPLPGTYRIRISKWPMLDQEFQITV
jgi:hypothetical protein